MTTYNDNTFRAWKRQKIENKPIKDVRNLFRLKEEVNKITIKDVRNLFPLKKEVDDTKIKDVRTLFRLKKENESITDGIIRDIGNLFEYDEDYYQPVRVNNFFSKTLSVKKYLNKITPVLKDIINNLK